MITAHTAIAGLLRSTALTLVTTAVTVSTRRSISIGSENALAAKMIANKVRNAGLADVLGATENTLIGYGRSLVVENNAGYDIFREGRVRAFWALLPFIWPTRT